MVKEDGEGWRAHRDGAVVLAWVAVCVVSVVMVEGLGAFGWLSRWGVVGAWGVVLVVALVGWGVVARRWRSGPRLGQRAAWTWGERALAACVAVMLGAALVAGVQAGTNNADALNYHLPRQFMWLQQGSLDHYPAWNAWQLMYPPLAEMLGVQLMAVTGGDRLAALPQWLALVASIAAVSAIGRELGLSRRGRLAAAVLLCSSPQAYMWATNAKNDLVLASLVAALVWIALVMWRRRVLTFGAALACGLLAGLAVLTKSTAVAILVPIGVVLVIAGWRAAGSRSLAWWAWASVVAVAVNALHWERNLVAFGSALGPTTLEAGAYDVLAERVTAGSVLTGTALRVAAHLTLPWEPWNAALKGAIEWLGAATGAAVTDARFVHRPDRWNLVLRFWRRDEDLYGSLVLMGGMLGSVALSAWRALRSRQRCRLAPVSARSDGHHAAAGGFLLVVGVVVGAFVLMSAITKWSVWDTRYAIALLPLAAVVVVGTLSWRWVRGVVVVSMLIGLAAAVMNERRGFLVTNKGGARSVLTESVDELRYRQREELRGPLERGVAVAGRVLGERGGVVGLKWPHNERVYLAMAAMRQLLGDGTRVVAFAPRFPVGAIDAARADVVIALEEPGAEVRDRLDRAYVEVWREGKVSVYRPAETGTAK